MNIPNILISISKQLTKKNANAIVVGGYVRDYFLRLPSKDIDIEVYGLSSMDELEKILLQYGSVNLVGKSFGVLKFIYKEIEYDFSFPRVEVKRSQGHKGFDVKVDGGLSFKEASKRRDFRMNAMGYDIESKQFLDPFGGLEDIKRKELRHIDDITFKEDPLRVYRAIQFCARFGLTLAKESFSLCHQMVEQGMLEELSKERVYEEWKKLLLKASKPSLGFRLMQELGILKYYPELNAIIDVPQSPKWHTEGDVWTHTLMAVDVMAGLCKKQSIKSKKEKLKFMFAILCHDFDKATHTTIDEDGEIRAIGDGITGLEPTKKLLYRLMDEHDFIETVLPFVKYHLKPSQFYTNGAEDAAFRRLATKVNIEELVLVAKADFLGRTTKEALVYEAGEWMLEKARHLKVSKTPIRPLIQGRDLIALGMEPSPKFKKILDAVYHEQLEGSVLTKEEALVFVREYLNKIER
jgi:tRNA nucleotidyltransferase (CCA-adding enzyme)